MNGNVFGQPGGHNTLARSKSNTRTNTAKLRIKEVLEDS